MIVRKLLLIFYGLHNTLHEFGNGTVYTIYAHKKESSKCVSYYSDKHLINHTSSGCLRVSS